MRSCSSVKLACGDEEEVEPFASSAMRTKSAIVISIARQTRSSRVSEKDSSENNLLIDDSLRPSLRPRLRYVIPRARRHRFRVSNIRCVSFIDGHGVISQAQWYRISLPCKFGIVS